MKAIVVENYGGPDVLTPKEVTKPQPESGQILVRLHAAGVNPVDTYLRSGTQGYTPNLPWTPGMDGAGVVEAIGEGAEALLEGVEVGSRVYTIGSLTGTYAEYCLCSPSQIFPLPENLDWKEGACLGVPYFTAARALFTKGNIAERQSLLVHGATGGVGMAALQLAADRGLRLLGSAGSESGRRLVEAHGAACFNHRDKGHFAEMRAHLDGGVDLIIEMLADVNLDDDLKLLNAGGLVVVVGSRGRIEITPRDLMNCEASVTGMKMPYSTPEERRQYASLIARSAAVNHVKPPIAEVYSLDRASEAHRQVIRGPHGGNLVIALG